MNHPHPTKYQEYIASLLGIDVSGDTQSVAAARIQDFLSPAVEVNIEIRPVTSRQIQLAKSLGVDVSEDSFNVAFAKIGDKFAERNKELLDELQLMPGDWVVKQKEDVLDIASRTFMISSIGRNGRIYFKGGNGWGAWPHEIKKVEPS